MKRNIVKMMQISDIFSQAYESGVESQLHYFTGFMGFPFTTLTRRIHGCIYIYIYILIDKGMDKD